MGVAGFLAASLAIGAFGASGGFGSSGPSALERTSAFRSQSPSIRLSDLAAYGISENGSILSERKVGKNSATSNRNATVISDASITSVREFSSNPAAVLSALGSVVAVEASANGWARFGTGAVVSSSGSVITSSRLLAGATSIRLTDTEGESVVGQLSGLDAATGLALISGASSFGLKPMPVDSSGILVSGDSEIELSIGTDSSQSGSSAPGQSQSQSASLHPYFNDVTVQQAQEDVQMLDGSTIMDTASVSCVCSGVQTGADMGGLILSSAGQLLGIVSADSPSSATVTIQPTFDAPTATQPAQATSQPSGSNPPTQSASGSQPSGGAVPDTGVSLGSTGKLGAGGSGSGGGTTGASQPATAGSTQSGPLGLGASQPSSSPSPAGGSGTFSSLPSLSASSHGSSNGSSGSAPPSGSHAANSGSSLPVISNTNSTPSSAPSNAGLSSSSASTSSSGTNPYGSSGTIAVYNSNVQEFVIPASIADYVAQQLATVGDVEYGWIGIEGQSAPAGFEGPGSPSGVVIDSVGSAGPAEEIGLRSGDLIISVGPKQVSDLLDLQSDISLQPPGTMEILTVLRNGESIPCPVVLGSTRSLSLNGV